MVKLLDKNNNVITLFTNLNNYYIQSTLEDAEKLIHFSVARSTPYSEELIEENYLETEDYRFVIKEVNFNSKDYIQVFGKLDVDDLRATLIRDYESVEKPLSTTLDELLIGTGWTHDVSAPHKLRTVRVDPEEDEPRTIKEIILRAMNTYDYEVEFDSLFKVVRVREKLGADRGAYLQTELNIRRLERQSDTYDFRTRLYAYGKDNLTFADINDGKEYVENFSFSNKILETTWRDNRYIVKENLLEAAHKKLAEVAKPRTSFAIEILQLTNLNPIYSILDYCLGDSVKLIDSTNEIIETHRIVKLTEYPLTPERNQVELSNTQLKFKTTQKEQIKEIAAQEATKTETALMREIERVNQLISSPEKGYVIVRKDENGNIYEQLIMDTDDVATAQNVWRWNIHGLAHSSTGYNGDYELALTKDGSINANMITTGALFGGEVKWNLDNGTLLIGENVANHKLYWDGEALSIKGSLHLSSGVSLDDEVDNLHNEIENIELTPGPAGEDATTVFIESVNGNIFKNANMATTLVITVITGSQQIASLAELKAKYGENARLQWSEKKYGELNFTPLSDGDVRLVSDNFMLNISANDVLTKSTFKCDLLN